MAEKIEGNLNQRRGFYDWDSWLDGSQWKLTKGVDFECTVGAMRTGAAAACARRGLKLTAKVGDGFVLIQAIKDEQSID